MKVARGLQMRELDKVTIESTGIPGIVLMENAAQAVAKACILCAQRWKNPRVAIVCGGGNNGGDGFAVARILKSKGIQSKIVFIGDQEKLAGDALINYRVAQNLNIPIENNFGKSNKIFECEDIIIDGIFGTGFSGEPRSLAGAVLKEMNQSGKYIISIDIPSGVNADTGMAAESSVQADETITFALPKIGTIIYPGHNIVGS